MGFAHASKILFSLLLLNLIMLLFSDYTGQGVDQLMQLIHTIRTNPNDRRMILSAWNPAGIYVWTGALKIVMWYFEDGDVVL